MTQEDKQLLLQDLCARLPYGVKVQVYDNRYVPTTLTAIDIEKQECIFNFNAPIENCLPYLRPMSNMSVEELLERGRLSEHDYYGLMDWLNKHHFDYRGLILQGLALEAPEDMYNLKEK